MGVIIGLIALLLALAFLIQSLADGYWAHGTYGALVLPALGLCFLLLIPFARTFWAHVINGSAVISFHDGSFHYMRDGLSLVTSTKICSVEVTKDGLVKSLAFIGEGGIVVAKYSLLLSSVPADEVANRARKFIGMQAA